MHQDRVGRFSSLTKLFILKSLGTLGLALECESIFSAVWRLVRCMKHCVNATDGRTSLGVEPSTKSSDSALSERDSASSPELREKTPLLVFTFSSSTGCVCVCWVKTSSSATIACLRSRLPRRFSRVEGWRWRELLLHYFQIAETHFSPLPPSTLFSTILAQNPIFKLYPPSLSLFSQKQTPRLKTTPFLFKTK